MPLRSRHSRAALILFAVAVNVSATELYISALDNAVQDVAVVHV